MKVSETDHKIRLLQNFTFLAYMLGLKKILDECFDSDLDIDFSKAVDKAI